VEFLVVDDSPQTVLRRAFGPRWRRCSRRGAPTIPPAWWGQFNATVPECLFDLRDDGAYRIVMQTGDGTRYPMVDTPHDVVAPERFSMVVNLAEHPGEWIDIVRPKGTELEHVPVQWHYEIYILEDDGSTTVEMLATYPVLDDRDAMVRVGGERAWAESFVKLDAPLA
jgi:uncharacterized protein YndB with AHSA1/START domain